MPSGGEDDMAALWTNKTAVYDAHMTLDEVSAIAAANGTPAQLAVLQRLKEDLSTLHGGLTAMVKAEFEKNVAEVLAESHDVQDAIFDPNARPIAKLHADVWKENEYKLHEKHIGPHLGERCVAVLSDPTTDLGRQAHAFTHHLADLSLDVVRAQQRVGSGAQERRPEGAPGPGDSVQRVPDAIDSQLLVRLEQEGIYRGPAP